MKYIILLEQKKIEIQWQSILLTIEQIILNS
jgi:hypothetical protein